MASDQQRLEAKDREFIKEMMRRTKADARVGELQEQLEAYTQALRDVHDYQCGCDQPGRLDVCVAQPVVIFEILREPSSPASEPRGGRMTDEATDDEATDWYISRAHAVRALGYVGASLAENGDLDPDFEQPKLLELFADGLAKTISADDLSPVDARAVELPT